MIRSGFFNSINKDRLYNANGFAEYFATFIGNGVFPSPSNNLQIVANNDMTVTIKAGKAWINGYIVFNDDDYILNIEPADGVLNRIDRIVARYDTVDREIRLEVKQGAYSSSPVAPILQRDADAYELALADILVGNGVISITQANITDLRLNNELCGIVHGTVDQVDTTTLFNQYLTWLDEKKNQYDADMLDWTSQKQLEYENWKAQQESNMDNWQAQEQFDFENWKVQEKSNFDDWFADIQDILEGDVAANLASRISSLENDFTSHQADDVSQGEVHGQRVVDGKFEYFDGQEWQRVKSDGYPVGNISNFNAKSDDKQITLTWQDPDDVTITDSNDNIITIARWKSTKILRKTGSYPVNENDGVLVVDNGIRNQYAESGFADTGLQNDIEYFYMAFPYTEEDVYTVDEVNRISSIPTDIKIYGIEVDESNSNPDTRVTYTDDAVGFTPCSGNNGAFNWGSWEDVVKNEFKIAPCVLFNPSKIVNYYLNYDDYTKKIDSSNSILTGADGDVMVEFGQNIYWKWVTVGSIQKIQISTKMFDGAVKPTFETEEGYNQLLYFALLLTQILFPILFKSTDSQTALGRGYVDENSGATTTGKTNEKGFMYGETTGKQQMKFLGIEDFWGNLLQWIDGLVSDSAYDLLIGNSNFNDTGSGYTRYPSGISAETAGYVDKVQGGNEKGFIIKTKNGSETTHYADYGTLYSSRVANFGGSYSDGSHSGFAYLRLSSSASHAAAIIGARLFCAKNGKIYIGAYLGTTQSGKLRSVSGTTPTASKTIGAFRTEARANNV
mgnify:CR=1 FL=1